MHIRAPALLLAARPHGETAAIARVLTERYGLVAAYVAGARGRHLRPVMIPGNAVELQLSVRSEHQLPFARLELTESRGPWMVEPLPAAAIGWVCALTATALPERHPYPALFSALEALLRAICHAPSARGWAGALVAYETLLLRELGYGENLRPPDGDLPEIIAAMERIGPILDHYLLAERRGDVMAARIRLKERLERMV
ncbi:DNA recombination protein RecO [Altericroceibacterium spongiae]|uniref:DNA repair protein RecO n=1 Tax=Altericroceibacterium spongiae TaxID=2320269 RepID=A0A420EMJ6_9SPHN|nr:recombination protein O N-terminal domain-containing protein [Altericroceibacterium spongiae]RKF21861.1 DNA recombination protein RecO [Altericroceibacterium spongiae]